MFSEMFTKYLVDPFDLWYFLTTALIYLDFFSDDLSIGESCVVKP